MPQQILLQGPLAAMQQVISSAQQARQEHGWIMDIYLLRRTVAVAVGRCAPQADAAPAGRSAVPAEWRWH
jgi:precorrin-6A synthase